MPSLRNSYTKLTTPVSATDLIFVVKLAEGNDFNV